MSTQKPKTDIFYQIRNGARGTAAMLAGMKLDLFTPLKDGPLQADQLALKLKVNAGKLAPLLYALVTVGLLTEENGAFSNSAASNEYLVKGKEGYMGDTYKIWSSNLLASLKTAETISTGIPQSKYDWKNMSENELKALYEGMSANDYTFAEQLSAKFDFSTCRTLLDAGGGSGCLAIAMTHLHPNLKATVVDFPQVTGITKHFINEANASDKVDIQAADLATDSIQGMYDVAFLSAVLQTLSASDAQEVVKNVGRAVNPGGWLYIFGSGILENSRLSPKSAVEFNLVFINVYDKGQSYTENEYRTWLEYAGFEDINFNAEKARIIARKQANKNL